ncbi:MAG: dTMP kinase, partial [Bacteroidota bacterium]
MNNKSLFIAVEGLDGSGKSTISKMVVDQLNERFPNRVQHSFEPHDASCGGQWIRDVLAKRIPDFSHEALALAFAANRKDHNDRVIGPWLEGGEGRILITDRYYLSSLVYQSTETIEMKEVMYLNRFARKPD